MTGLDTGFFVELLRGNSEAITVWKAIVDGMEDASVSCLTVFELKRLALKGALKADEVETTVQAIFAVGEVAWIDSTDVCELASRLSHGLGIPAIDALILAGLLDSGAREIYTTDSHFEAYKKDGLAIKRL
ncbi:MAG: PIN domain-containing protein [Proteobacteria bacterium]|nr:PIN domain-containing protein [Pseudomonadota bacterium]